MSQAPASVPDIFRRAQSLLRENPELIERVDELGYDYAFAVEHHFRAHESWMPSPPVYCTGAASLRSNAGFSRRDASDYPGEPRLCGNSDD